MKRKKMLSLLCMAAGAIIMLGTAGASDAGAYNLWQSFIGIIFGAAVAWVGVMLATFKN